jgi:hypothetical protein
MVGVHTAQAALYIASVLVIASGIVSYFFNAAAAW